MKNRRNLHESSKFSACGMLLGEHLQYPINKLTRGGI